MYLGEIAIGYNTFLTEISPHVKRIHITHTDMDGIGCAVIHKCASMVLSDAGCQSPLTTIYLPKPSKVNDTIIEAANTVIAQGFDREHDMLAFLITDLGGVKPATFDYIREELGVPCYYVVIDHHMSDVINFSGVIPIHSNDSNIIRGRGWYFTETSICATDILYNIVHDIYNSWKGEQDLLNSKTYRIVMFLVESLHKFADAVNRYDTGHWGKWNVDKYTDICEEIMLQMIYDTYSTDKRYDDAVDDIMKLMTAPDQCGDLRAKYEQIVQEKFIELKETYRYFVDHMKDSDSNQMEFHVGDITVKAPIRVKYYEIKEKSQNIHFFSIISREILETRDDIDMLMVVNHLSQTVEIRSTGSIHNAGYLAKLNGGGGHFNASGFPFPEDDKVKE